ncbi:MAG: glycoside hydrolase family 2 protein [Chitinophagaceae bacterium]
MKSFFFFLSIIFAVSAAGQWKPAGENIKTNWASAVNPKNVLPEYPRPQMVRKQWMNLNGIWQYSIQQNAVESTPSNFQGDILVPFAIESSLSGVGKRIGKDSVLWYHRTFDMPAAFRKGKVLLHFGAVDWKCDVFINDHKVGSHQGGYDPFYLDITSALSKSANQNVTIKVWDPTDDGPQPRGKQVKNPNSIWYTPVTGIWQTVWLENVPSTYIHQTKQTPDLDKNAFHITAQVVNALPADRINVSVWEKDKKISESNDVAGQVITLTLDHPKLWSPADPFLYDLKVSLIRNGKIIDEVTSYAAMRKISVDKDQAGMSRMKLNNDFLFQFGPLDQGWWPDGLYTAPTDEALKFDIEKTKDMGFNMIRKHVKVEPARWYYYCDVLGMMVWQDMPSGDLGNEWESRPGIIGTATDQQRSAESETIYKDEWNEIMHDLYNFPSIVVWVPFNEGWGQFKTKEITEWTMKHDPSRLVNSASGGSFEDVGHIMDLHNYPEPCMPDPEVFGKSRVIVLGEYGGLGLPLEGHTWQQKNNWGYQSYKTKEDLLKRYAEFIGRIPNLISKGLSAAIYTQTTDVEVEINGLMTYDRKIVKMPEQQLRILHSKLYSVKVN